MDEGKNGGDGECRKVRNGSGSKMVVGGRERNVKRQNETRESER